MQTFVQLCASAAVIALRNMPLNWESFVDDMMQMANSSNENLYTVLEIFSDLHREYTQTFIQEKYRIKVNQ